MSNLPTFIEIRDVVTTEVLDATNAYTLLTRLAFPLGNQQRLVQHYPYLITTLVRALGGQVVMPVCRLFDPDEDPRHASLSSFLRGVENHHAHDKDVEPRLIGWRREYVQAIPGYLADIKTRWKVLAQHRSAYLAHRDLSKKNLPSISYGYFRECFELAQKIVGAKDDPDRFMKWCRLDDYEGHFQEDMRRWENNMRRELGRGDA
jgi:HEPN superfamily AbiU2-like protein